MIDHNHDPPIDETQKYLNKGKETRESKPLGLNPTYPNKIPAWNDPLQLGLEI